jgi:phage-related protein
MEQKWKIIYYKSPNGQFPVFEFIEDLKPLAKAKIYNTFELLKEYNILLGPPHVKKLTGRQLWELRILGSDNLRIFYVAIKGKAFLLLHGFKKKKQKTDQKEITTALERFFKYREKQKT